MGRVPPPGVTQPESESDEPSTAAHETKTAPRGAPQLLIQFLYISCLIIIRAPKHEVHLSEVCDLSKGGMDLDPPLPTHRGVDNF